MFQFLCHNSYFLILLLSLLNRAIESIFFGYKENSITIIFQILFSVLFTLGFSTIILTVLTVEDFITVSNFFVVLLTIGFGIIRLKINKLSTIFEDFSNIFPTRENKSLENRINRLKEKRRILTESLTRTQKKNRRRFKNTAKVIFASAFTYFIIAIPFFLFADLFSLISNS